MPIAFEVHYTDGTKDSKTVWIENKHHEVKVENILDKKVSFVLFDPNSEVMKSFEFKKSFTMLKEQAMKAPNMIDRYDAILALRDTSLSLKQDLLINAFNNEKFHAVKSEIIFQLVSENDAKSLELIKNAINDKDAAVRKSVIQNVKTIPSALRTEYEKLLTDLSYETVALALEKLSLQFPENTKKYLDATKNMEGYRGRNVLVKWLEVASSTDKKYSNELVDLTSSSYEFMTRQNAFSSLRKLDYFNQIALKNTLDGAFSSNNRLASPAIETLKYFYTKNESRKMIADYLASKKWNDWESVIVKQVQN